MEISVSLSAIKENLLKVKKQLPKNVKLTFMVKADAYNHGVQRVAPYVKGIVDNFGVATAKEGAYLRLIGIENRILVTAYTDADQRDCEFYRLTPMLGTLSAIKNYARKGKEFDLKIDTGMCRLGLQPEQLDEVSAFLKANEAAPRGICSHLQYTDERREEQLNSFFCASQRLGVPDAVKHIANSHAALTDSRFCLDEVRVGIIGYGGLDGYGFRQAMTVTATVEDIKHIKAGSKVGYDGLFVAERDSDLAFVRSGYYDGVLRSLAGAEVVINGKKAKIAGAVSMDSFMADITGLDVTVGDTVEYISENNTAESLARAALTIPYEVLTALKGRHTRRYYGETNCSAVDKTFTDGVFAKTSRIF